MTVCSGASQLRAGVPATVVVDAPYIKNLLPVGLSWLYDYLPFMHGLEIGNTTSFCSVDPPTFSLPTTDQFLSFLVGGPFTEVQVVSQFLQDITRAYLWYNLCECASGSPTPITPPTEPTDMPAINPAPYVTPPTNAACQHLVSNQYNSPGVSGFAGLFPDGLPNGTGFQALPKGATAIVLKAENIINGGSPASWAFRINQRDSSGTVTSVLAQTNVASGVTTTFQKNISATAIDFYVDAAVSTGGTTNYAKATVDFYCGGGPGQIVTPCCPPDPVATGLMRQILDMVTLIQRQAVPFGYVTGTAHTGLSGAGNVDISGILGVKVDVTTLPGSYGREGTSPTEYFDLGFLTFGTADGYPMAVRLEREHQLSMPARCSAFTNIAWDLAPGIVIDLTEILREP